MKTIITKMSIIGLIVLMMASCRKDPAMPGGEFVNIKTNEITEITGFSAVVSAYVGADCDERGVCWSTSPNPTVSDWHTADGSGTGSFTSSITGLVTNKTYYVRAYATNGRGTSYGEQKSFTTLSVFIPTVTTYSVWNISQTAATCGGEVTSDGGAAVTARGVCWSTSPTPTVSNYHTTNGSGTGSFTSSITGLTANTTYYVRAYATNSKGTSYGEQKSFTTQSGGGTQTTPTVTTASVSNITQTAATCGGEVTSDGGAAVTARGVCWSTSQNPTVSNYHTTNGSGTGSFTGSITELWANTTYYIRAYATNSAGTSYGEQKSFTTLGTGGGTQTTPTVTTYSVWNISQYAATCGGEVTSDGGATVTARGVCWSVSSFPTVSDSHTTNGSGTGYFTSSITGLTANTTYYVRAYATNSKGTSYGEQKSFTTQSGGGGDLDYVDLGLPSGLLWATCNVGADSPEDYGWYFMWGSVTEGGDSYCSWANCPGNGGNSSYNVNAIAAWNATHLTNNVLNPEVDAASVNWGGDWRMPTSAEWQELYNNTNSTWTTENGKFGRKFASKTDAAKYIFLPAAGNRSGTSLYGAGSYGYYWSSSLYSSIPNYAYNMKFYSGYVNPHSSGDRCYGFSVRPVRAAR